MERFIFVPFSFWRSVFEPCSLKRTHSFLSVCVETPCSLLWFTEGLTTRTGHHLVKGKIAKTEIEGSEYLLCGGGWYSGEKPTHQKNQQLHYTTTFWLLIWRVVFPVRKDVHEDTELQRLVTLESLSLRLLFESQAAFSLEPCWHVVASVLPGPARESRNKPGFLLAKDINLDQD